MWSTKSHVLGVGQIQGTTQKWRDGTCAGTGNAVITVYNRYGDSVVQKRNDLGHKESRLQCEMVQAKCWCGPQRVTFSVWGKSRDQRAKELMLQAEIQELAKRLLKEVLRSFECCRSSYNFCEFSNFRMLDFNYFSIPSSSLIQIVTLHLKVDGNKDWK